VIPFRQNNKVRVAYSFSFARADKEADYPGGKGAWRGFLQNEVDQSALRKGTPVGTYIVYVQFIRMPDGKVGEVRALSKNGFGMEE
jgi:hypothetical protein